MGRIYGFQYRKNISYYQFSYNLQKVKTFTQRLPNCAVPLQPTTTLRTEIPHHAHPRTPASRAWRNLAVARRSGLLPGTPLVLRLGGALGTEPLDNDCLVTRHTPTLSNNSPAPLTHLHKMTIAHLIPPMLAQPPITWLPGNCVQRLTNGDVLYSACRLCATICLLCEGF